MSKKFWPILYSNFRYKMSQDFLDIYSILLNMILKKYPSYFSMTHFVRLDVLTSSLYFSPVPYSLKKNSCFSMTHCVRLNVCVPCRTRPRPARRPRWCPAEWISWWPARLTNDYQSSAWFLYLMVVHFALRTYDVSKVFFRKKSDLTTLSM